MPRPVSLLVALCRETMLLNQEKLADLLGSSLRTVQRWEARRATPYAWDLHKLADAVRPHDPALAAEVDEWAPRPQPPPPQTAPPVFETAPLPLPPPPSPVTAAILVDSVVCAAAEAMGLAPQALRPAVLAAFVRARDAGLTGDGVIAVLSPPAPQAPAAKAKAAKS